MRRETLEQQINDLLPARPPVGGVDEVAILRDGNRFVVAVHMRQYDGWTWCVGGGRGPCPELAHRASYWDGHHPDRQTLREIAADWLGNHIAPEAS